MKMQWWQHHHQMSLHIVHIIEKQVVNIMVIVARLVNPVMMMIVACGEKKSGAICTSTIGKNVSVILPILVFNRQKERKRGDLVILTLLPPTSSAVLLLSPEGKQRKVGKIRGLHSCITGRPFVILF